MRIFKVWLSGIREDITATTLEEAITIFKGEIIKNMDKYLRFAELKEDSP